MGRSDKHKAPSEGINAALDEESNRSAEFESSSAERETAAEKSKIGPCVSDNNVSHVSLVTLERTSRVGHKALLTGSVQINRRACERFKIDVFSEIFTTAAVLRFVPGELQ